jgi:hypothetical protein
MASLTGNLISSTYQSVLKITTNNTASAALNNVTDGLGNVTGLYVSTATTAVSGTFAVLGNMTVSGILAATSSNATSALSSSFAQTASFVTTAQTASYILNAISSSFAVSASNANLLDGLDSTVFATTGSNQFKSDQSITGSVSITNVLRLTAQDPLPAASSVPNSFAVSASTPTKPYYSDGTNWNALY